MHPEILRQIAAQQIGDQRARAHRDRVGRTLARALRGHRGTAGSDGYVAPAVPDYVDGSFRVADQAEEGVSPVPAARTAA
jgi:hypothetical protein